MGIQFYNNLNNYSNYNNYHRNIPQVSVNEALENEKKASENTSDVSVSSYSPKDAKVEASRQRIASLEDISLTFNKEESFDYIGADASVKSLDMEKAISDMKKDGILQQYQYFVGESKNLFASEDGVVIPKNL